jgi:chromate transporter
VAGVLSGSLLGPYLVLVLLGCGAVELGVRTRLGDHVHSVFAVAPLLAAASVATGGLGALAWVAFKVGALSYGGGFVIVPLMRGDAVHTYHWLTNGSSSAPWRSAR